jgi:hypothetical protein
MSSPRRPRLSFGNGPRLASRRDTSVVDHLAPMAGVALTVLIRGIAVQADAVMRRRRSALVYPYHRVTGGAHCRPRAAHPHLPRIPG